MKYWLFKSEASCYSIDDLKEDKRTAWTGIRNYQARNFIKDEMKGGDPVLFYHSSSNEVGIYGTARVKTLAYPDITQFDEKGEYYDPKATREKPRWFTVDILFVSKFKYPVTLHEMRLYRDLVGLVVLEKGSRLSIQPVSKKHFDRIIELSKVKK